MCALLRITLAFLAIAAQSALTFASDLMNTPRPLLFNDLVAFDTTRHQSLALPAERHNFAFAAQVNLLPLTFAEVGPALRSYPVVFVAEGETLALVALVGLPGDRNRFIDALGEWRPGAYIPAYVRGYPFISLRPSESMEPVLAFDPTAPDFKTPGGHPLLDTQGNPGEQLKGIMAFQGEYRALAERTVAMGRALKDAGVLEEGSLQIRPEGGETKSIGGFLVVSEARLKALSADVLKQLMEADALGLAYAQILSMGSLGNLFAVPDQPSAQPTKSAKANSSGNTRSRQEATKP